MKKNIGIKLILLILFISNCYAWGQKRNENQEMNAFVSNLLKKMTLEEKLGQLKPNYANF